MRAFAVFLMLLQMLDRVVDKSRPSPSPPSACLTPTPNFYTRAQRYFLQRCLPSLPSVTTRPATGLGLACVLFFVCCDYVGQPHA